MGAAGAGAGEGALWERLIVTCRGPLPDGAYVPEPDERPEPGAYDGGLVAEAGWNDGGCWAGVRRGKID